MCELTIPPSPNWYLSNILACNDDGTTVAYGAKYELVILKRAQQKKFKASDFQPKYIPLAHKDKINAVVFAPSNSEYSNQIVTCSDDCTVHVWDYTTQSLLLSHSGHSELQKIVGVDWSRADPNLIVSVSDLGSVVSWDLPSNTIRRLLIGTKVQPNCIAACPHKRDLIAIGAKAGVIIIFSIKGEGSIKFRIKGHDCDVVSLSWCPVPHNIFHNDEGDKNTYLLASGGKNRSIYFWRAGTDGRYETFINLPIQPIATTGYRNKNGIGSQSNNWVCVRWISDNNLLTSSLFGELLCYDLKEFFAENLKDPSAKKGKSKSVKLIHGVHSRGLFSIAVPYHPKINSDDLVVWTYALDKHLVACILESSRQVADFLTIGGIVYCMAVSPLDPNRIAIGTGDNRILIWNVNNESGTDITAFWNKINSKVMAIAWHPTQDFLLAFGTGEGRIGLLDCTGSKPCTLLRLYHRKCVYSLIWAPPIMKSDIVKPKKYNITLFSVGDGEILQYDTDFPDKDPISLSPLFKNCDAISGVSKTVGRTDLTWKYDHSLAAVGNDNGVLYIVDGENFSPVHTIFAHKKLVQCIVWHPATVTSENSMSPYSSWLASASDNIQIINVTKEGVETVGCLNTHTERVVSLAWSPHFNARLVSASYDYTSQVWDVVTGSVLACFDGHHCAVVCCLPSALHQDHYITGSADNTVRVWNMNKFNLTKTKTKKQRLSGVLKKFANAQEAIDKTPVVNLKHVTPKFDSSGMEEKPISEVITKSKSMFPVTSSGITTVKCLDILWNRLNGKETTSKTSDASTSGYLDFFGDSKSIRRLMTVEENHHRETGNTQYIKHLSLWSGNLNQTIIDACRKKQLDAWLVSLAPMVSHKLWVDCCKSYAIQLAEVGNYYQAVSYLLSIHQVEEAIDILLDAKLFREAVVVAKSRLPSDDPTVRKALMLWANCCVGNGMLTLAAHCLLNNGANIEAVEVLARTNDAHTLSLAAEIAYKSEALEMALSLAMRAINESLAHQEWTVARNTVNQHPVLKDLMLWINICSLLSEWKSIDINNGLSWIYGTVENKCQNIFDKAVQLCSSSLPSYTTLSKFLPNKPTPDSQEKMWSYVCGQISLAAAAKMQPSNIKSVLKHLLQGMEVAYNYYLHNPTKPQLYLQISAWFAPKGPFSELSIYDPSVLTLTESFQTFLSCSTIYWLDYLNNNTLVLPYDDKEKMQVVTEIIKKCAHLLFHKDVIRYHKLAVELKKLENNIAAFKLKTLQLNKSMKHCKDIEEQLHNGGGDANCLNGSAKSEASNVDPVEDESENVKKLMKLKSLKEKFEDERVCSPNPFLMYCTLRNTLQSFVGKQCEISKTTLIDIKKIWDKVSFAEE